MQIDAEIVGQHEFDPSHHIVGAGRLTDVHEQATRGDGAPVDAAGIEHTRLVGPVGQNLQMFVGDHARATGDGVPGALADQVRRQVPIGIERGEADHACHFRSWHRALADDDAHPVADAAVLDHPEPGRGGVDQDIASLNRRNGARALDIGEDQPLVISGAAIEGGDGGRVGAASDGEAVHLLEDADGRRGIRSGGEAEALAELIRPVGGDLVLGEAGPAGAIGGETPDEAVIGRVARQSGAGEVRR